MLIGENLQRKKKITLRMQITVDMVVNHLNSVTNQPVRSDVHYQSVLSIYELT